MFKYPGVYIVYYVGSTFDLISKVEGQIFFYGIRLVKIRLVN